MSVSVTKSPRCGLYRTTRPHPHVPEEVPAGMLVNLHTCKRALLGPEVHLPRFNAYNRWEWCREGYVVSPFSWLETLVSLPPEGFYVLRAELEFEGALWPARSLVQLGYSRNGEALLFLAQRRHHLAENSLFFAGRGVPLGGDPRTDLEPLVIYDEPDPNAFGGEAPHAA